jgi:hypothetical protein
MEYVERFGLFNTVRGLFRIADEPVSKTVSLESAILSVPTNGVVDERETSRTIRLKIDCPCGCNSHQRYQFLW